MGGFIRAGNDVVKFATLGQSWGWVGEQFSGHHGSLVVAVLNSGPILRITYNFKILNVNCN